MTGRNERRIDLLGAHAYVCSSLPQVPLHYAQMTRVGTSYTVLASSHACTESKAASRPPSPSLSVLPVIYMRSPLPQAVVVYAGVRLGGKLASSLVSSSFLASLLGGSALWQWKTRIWGQEWRRWGCKPMTSSAEMTSTSTGAAKELSYTCRPPMSLALTTSSARTTKQDIPVPDRGLDALDELLVLLVRGEGTGTDSPDDVVVVNGLFLRSRDKGVDWMVERFRDALRQETIQEQTRECGT